HEVIMTGENVQCDFCLSGEARYRLRTANAGDWLACIACLYLIKARKVAQLSDRAWHKFSDTAQSRPENRKLLQAEFRRSYDRFFETWTGTVEELPKQQIKHKTHLARGN